MNKDLTRGPVMRSMLWFALPMILGNLLQQCYNIADTLIVGRFLGKTALAAVGSSFSLMTFLTSILLGLCMGSGALFSIRFGQRDETALKESVRASFVLILGVTLLLNGLAFACLDLIKSFLQVPDDVWGDMRAYIAIVFAGIFATFLYNYFASYLRAMGNSVVPLVFLAVSAVLNIALDLWFVIARSAVINFDYRIRIVLSVEYSALFSVSRISADLTVDTCKSACAAYINSHVSLSKFRNCKCTVSNILNITCNSVNILAVRNVLECCT